MGEQRPRRGNPFGKKKNINPEMSPLEHPKQPACPDLFRSSDELVSSSSSPPHEETAAAVDAGGQEGPGEKQLSRSNSLGAAAWVVASVIITCFVPRHSKRVGYDSPKSDDIQDMPGSSSMPVLSSDSDECDAADPKTPTTAKEQNFRKLKYTLSTERQRRDASRFTAAEIYKATENFSKENIIGQGSTGTVYKGKLEDGSMIAIKRARKNVNEKHIIIDFKNEMKTLSKVEHLNLVRFLGFLEKDNEQILVVEYVGNGTLREHLDGMRGEALNIGERLDIAIDIAHAVTYLHMYTDHPIIHRDIKASNILLTEKLRAKVADFGFARRLAEEDDDQKATNVSTQVKGTFGYLDPEYLRTYHLTEKSDVYSYGVLLVELVTGRHPIERHRDEITDRVTSKWAMRKMKEGNAAEAMDPKLRRGGAGTVAAAERMLVLAAECVSPSRPTRPSMKRCAETLWEIRRDYREMRQRSAVLAATRRGAKAREEEGQQQAADPLPPGDALRSAMRRVRIS